MPATPDDVHAMVTFARVVETKSFTAAAAKLGVSKAAVSLRVAALERELKVTLLHRTTRKLVLTPEGAALYEHCARVASAADETALVMAGAGNEPRGILRVNAPIAFAEDYLATPMAAYLARYPAARIDLTLGDRTVELVEEGVDVAIRITTKLRGAGLVSRRLATDRMVLCAAPAYFARKGRPETPADLLHHDCLVYSLLRIADEWRFREPETKAEYALPIEARFSAASGAVIRHAAVAGMGIAVLPRFMVAADLATGRLQAALDALAAPPLGIYAVYPQARSTPSKVRAFVDLLATHFKTPRW